MNGRGKQIATTKQLNQIITYKLIKFMKHIKQLVKTSKAIKYNLINLEQIKDSITK